MGSIYVKNQPAYCFKGGSGVMNMLEFYLSRLEQVKELPSKNYRAVCPICGQYVLGVRGNTEYPRLHCMAGCDDLMILKTLSRRRPIRPVLTTWESITPFGSQVLPPFPTDALPDWLRLFVESLAKATQTPTDMAGVLSLCACAAAAAKAAEVAIG